MSQTGRKIVSLTALTVALMLSAVSLASATDIVWTTKQIPWSNKTGTEFTGAARDTAFITDENDTTRTAIIDTADWAWDALSGIGVAAGPVNIAYITIVARTNNGAADTLYFTTEKGHGSVLSRNRTLPVAAISASAVLQGDARADKAIYRGPIHWDTDGTMIVNQLSPGEDFRLVVQGDQSGTTPKLSQCRLYITYPMRRASQ